MAFLSIPNIRIAGISASVPKRKELCADYPLFSGDDAGSFSKTTGVFSRRISSLDVCSSDLCYYAAEKLLESLNWNREEIDCLVFVTQTPDYHIPSTSPILQKRLNLPETCLAIDISLGCSGYVYGLNVISSLMSHGLKKGLLLSGDTITKTCSKTDKSTYPLFGDAGSATAIEFSVGLPPFLSNLKVDGDGTSVIQIKDGGFRNPVSQMSFEVLSSEEGVSRNRLQLFLEGMDVFMFGITKVPENVKELAEHFSIDLDGIDYFTFHQANKFMNEKIRKKLKLPEIKVPYSLEEFGNTSCATIPLTLVTQLGEKLKSEKLSHIVCGFGVGLSWGSMCFETDKIVCPNLIEV